MGVTRNDRASWRGSAVSRGQPWPRAESPPDDEQEDQIAGFEGLVMALCMSASVWSLGLALWHLVR
jgi:hypothetical protein